MSGKPVPEGFKTVSEGKATVLFSTDKDQNAFYNEVQIKNRDLSVLVLNEYAKQLEREAIGQFRKRHHKQSWRRLLPDYEAWGVDNTLEPVEGETGLDLTGLRVLEALSASGLRSVRYAKEIVEGVGLDHLVVNDLEEHAVESIKRNLEFNDLGDDKRIVPNKGDACSVMHHHRLDQGSKTLHTRIKSFLPSNGKLLDETKDAFDVIDLDPYGSPMVFLDTAVQSVTDGGMLCVTATDLRTLCGNDSENCFGKYNTMPLKVQTAHYPHEMGIRMLLGVISREANKYGRCIVPVLSVHMDFYIRVFVRVYTDKKETKSISTKIGMVYQSRGCETFFVQPLGEGKNRDFVRSAASIVPEKCPETDANFCIGGPIWIAPIHNMKFVKNLLGRLEDITHGEKGFDATKLGAKKLIHGLLLNVSEELVDCPLHYELPHMCKRLGIETPSMKLVYSAIINAGYRVSKTHSSAVHIKTDAPSQVMWDILREWAKRHPPRNPTEVSQKILAKETSIKVDFSLVKTLKHKRDRSVARYAENPKPNWGPKARAVGVDRRQTHRKRRTKDERPTETNKKTKAE